MSLLMNKYQELSELCDKMTQNRVIKRPESCQQILNEKTLWTFSNNEFDVKRDLKELCDNCEEEYKNSYIFKLINKLLSPTMHRKCDKCSVELIDVERWQCKECEDYVVCVTCLYTKGGCITGHVCTRLTS